MSKPEITLVKSVEKAKLIFEGDKITYYNDLDNLVQLFTIASKLGITPQHIIFSLINTTQDLIVKRQKILTDVKEIRNQINV
jgi:hypothetical protein